VSKIPRVACYTAQDVEDPATKRQAGVARLWYTGEYELSSARYEPGGQRARRDAAGAAVARSLLTGRGATN